MIQALYLLMMEALYWRLPHALETNGFYCLCWKTASSTDIHGEYLASIGFVGKLQATSCYLLYMVNILGFGTAYIRYVSMNRKIILSNCNFKYVVGKQNITEYPVPVFFLAFCFIVL